MKDFAVVVSNDNKNVSPIETIDAIKKAGFKNVFIQWYDENWEYSQKEQLEYIRKQGLNVIFAHLGYQNINDIWDTEKDVTLMIERYKRNIKECKENNINLVIMHPTSGRNAMMYNKTGIQRIKEITDYAKQLGVKVAFENTKIKGYLEYIISNLNDDNVGICYDAGHCHVHFDDEFNYEFFKDKIFAVHLHDNDKSDDQHLLPFDGTIDWEYVISKLKYCNYNGPVTLELCYRNDYLNLKPEEFYKEGIIIAEKIANMFEI